MVTDFTTPAVTLISDRAIQAAHAKSRASGRPCVEVLEEEMDVRPEEFVKQLASVLSYSSLDIESLHGCKPAFELLPYAECVRRRCIVAHRSDLLVAIVADPFDLGLRSWVNANVGAVEWCLAHRDDLTAMLAIHEDTLRAIDGTGSMAPEIAGVSGTLEEISLASIAGHSSPIIRFVNSTIYDAMKMGASDIHLETSANGLQVKYRVDGVLMTVSSMRGSESAEQTVSRIKVMAELDIAERRIPQDGRFKLSVRGLATDFRVSIMPSVHGEDVVVRILDKRALTDQFKTLRLDLLGFDEASLVAIREMSREPYGLLLVTGPTGSGKTTTLYAALSEINTGQEKIITIEDPVEYQVAGVLQIPVNERKGLTFARGLRSILRHDPDKILVGEIRDSETAQIAIQSALTGHLVFTTVHANNVFDVLGRFVHMGVDTHSFVSALNGIVAQRLVRLVCPHCAVEVTYDDSEFAKSGLADVHTASMTFKRGRGCGQCRGTGYKGRSAIGEILRLNDELRELVASRAPIRAIKTAAKTNGTRFLRQSALALVAQGRTTLEEINRVTFSA